MSHGPQPQTNDQERFWRAVDHGERNDCWPWMRALSGGRDGSTYGLFTRSRRSPGRRLIYAHRMAYCLANNIDPGSFTGDVFVRHKCDNPRCCNPAHLEPGTPAQNVQDKVDRGRAPKGANIATSVLTEAQVRQIKLRLLDGDLHKKIAADFDVSRATISQIARGRNWAWVSPITMTVVV